MKRIISNFTLILLLILTTISCQKEQKTIHQLTAPDASFGQYVQAFTSGIISKKSDIAVHLTQPIDTNKVNLKDIFSLSPSVRGKAVLKNDNIVVFRPDKPLKSDEKYTVRFNLGAFREVKPEFRTMKFEFATIKQSFDVQIDGLHNYETTDNHLMKLSGAIITADIDSDKKTEELLKARYNSNSVPIKWIHESGSNQHIFIIDSLQRAEKDASAIQLTWNGKPLSIKKKGNKKVTIPAASTFTIIDAKVKETPSQHVEVYFSDPLKKPQNLSGLLKLESVNNPRISINGNVVKIWTSSQLEGIKELQIFEGIESVRYNRINQNTSFILEFNASKPQVRFIGKGVIVPQKKMLTIPFEAVSLKAVDVSVTQVFKNNVHQFFQENQLTGQSDLKKVGRKVYEGKINLQNSNLDINKWNTYKIDLANLFEIEQGAIYSVAIKFKKEYAAISCNKEDKNLHYVTIEQEEPYQSAWDKPGWYSEYYYPDNYQWKERNNPCHDSYYTSNKFVKRNIFASQLGITVKEGKGHTLRIATSNLLDIKLIQKARIDLYNFQNQLIESITTDNDGFATIELHKKPFFLIAQKDKQFGYLRLDDGNALSLSNFNVSGKEIQEGIKGFIYGVRDVRRPGDSLYINLMVESAIKKLSDDYPVVFKLFTPTGKLHERRVVTQNLNGIYSFLTKTDKEVPTGNWRVEANIGNVNFQKTIRIETIKPNRLKVMLSTPERPLTPKDNALVFQSMWLHGTPASNLTAKVDVLFKKTNTTFKGFENYTFTNHNTNFYFNEQSIFNDVLNQEGKASIPLKFNGLQSAPGMLNMWITSRVFESGGNFSTSIKSVKYAPFTSFIGLKMPSSEDNWYKTDTDYQPEIVIVDENGKPKAGDNIQIKLYKIDWRWWWESGNENLAHYVSGSQHKPVKKWHFSNSQHKTSFKINVPFRNWEDSGRYLLWAKDLTSGHSTSLTFYLSKYGSWRSDEMADGATMLIMRSDKKEYNVGEKVKITIPSSKKGRALVTIENGTEVSDMFWIKTEDKETSFNIETKPEMAPNFYVYVSLLQPYGQTKNDAPIRLYGVIPVSVKNKETEITPIINTASEFKPEKNYTIKVSEANNKAMSYTLAIVDEGLLGITNFKTPRPHAAFYAHEALGVKTWDMYDYVAGAYGARLEKAFAVGGDGAMLETNKMEVNRFKPIITYAGPFKLRRGETKKHQFLMPNYVGEVRVMVVARSKEAYGSAEKSVAVKKDLMVLATAPRKLAPGNKFKIPVEVFALKKGLKNATVSIKTNDFLKIDGASSQKVNFGKEKQKMVYFDAIASKQPGIAKVEVIAQSNGEQSTYKIELEISNPNHPVIKESAKRIAANDSWKTTIDIPGSVADSKAWVEVSGFPPLNLSNHLERLIRYPYGCIEQTTSTAFPQLYLDVLTKVSEEQSKNISNNIEKMLQKLVGFQLSNGGFGYWQGASHVSEWGTNYAGHFLLEAEKAGYVIDNTMKQKWLNFQKSAARNWYSNTYSSDFIQAYRLYTLALANEADLGSMNRLRERTDLSSQAAWRLATAYLLAGQKNAATEIIQNIGQITEEEQHYDYTFGSELRDQSMILETLVLLQNEEKAYQLLQEISEKMVKQSWLSTQTTAWCLLAASKYAKAYYKNDDEINFELTTNGKKQNIRSKLPIVKMPISPNNDNRIDLTINNKSNNFNFVRIVTQGVPIGIDETSASENLLMNVTFKKLNNEVISPNEIEQGSDFKMVVTVKHPGILSAYNELALNTLFPSGWEILNKRLSGYSSNNFEYQDIRDDKVYTFFDLKPNKQKTFEFLLNASYAGQFYLPPVSCQAMYNIKIRAQKPGKLVTVIEK